MLTALQRIAPYLRPLGLVVLLVFGLAIFAGVVDRHYAIREWLLWHYAAAWAAALLWLAACFSIGHAITVWSVGRRSLGLLEHATVSFAVGVFAFELTLFCVAAAGLLRPPMFFLVPLLLLAAGGRESLRFAVSVVPRIAQLRRAAGPVAIGTFVPIVLGVLALAMLYFIILTPQNVQFDARWKHMAMAEDMVASGGIRRFPEATLFAVRPHFASILYSWAFLLPSGTLFDRMIVGVHLEYTIFLVTTLVGIPAVVRRIAPGADARIVWTARFLFPGVFLYDGTLSGGADHIGAMFGPPIFLLTLRAWRNLSPRFTALLAVLLPAAALVKDTVALMFVIVPALAIAARSAWFAWRCARGTLEPAYRKRWLWSPVIATLVCVVLWAPHWLKNAILYGDPLYPMLARWFEPPDLLPDAEYLFEWGYKQHQFWRPTRDLAGVLETLKALYEWPFVPHNWASFHGKRPIIGAAFTLLLPALLLLRRTGRLWLLVIWLHVQIFLWYWVHHQDRYLQALMPMIAAATAGIVVLIWRSRSMPVRVSLVALLGFQVADGLDVYFIPKHAMAGQSIVRTAVDLLGKGHQGKYDERFAVQATQVELGRATPADALIVVHEDHNVLGFGRRLVHDWATWQYTLDYARMGSPRGLWRRYREMGVTHLAWLDRRSRSFDSIASDLMFFYFAEKYGLPVANVRGYRLVALPAEQPAEDEARFNDDVLVLSCPGGYDSGLYGLLDLALPSFGPRRTQFPPAREPANDALALARRAGFAVVDARCHRGKGKELGPEFKLIARRKRLRENPEYELYARLDRSADSEPAGNPEATEPPEDE